jgi:Fe-S-cluster containining protein
MLLTDRLCILRRLYQIYDRYAASLEIACKKHCCACCTCNVTLTTLEGYYILQAIDSDRIPAVRKAAEQQLKKPRFIPAITTNRLAELCVSGKAPPNEKIDVNWGNCPLLETDICPIYKTRPFACRCLMSTQDCRQTGIAEIDEFTMTVNNLFLQVIEHTDQDGFTGNLADILSKLTADCGMDEKPRPTSALIRNSPIPVLLVPPKHRDRIKPILSDIDAVLKMSRPTPPASQQKGPSNLTNWLIPGIH